MLGARLAIALACFLGAAPAAAASTPDPSFFGVQGWSSPDGRELRSLQRAGVGSVRVGFNRASVVDRFGVHHWGELDEQVIDAARTGIDLLPVLVHAPHVDGHQRARPPRTPAARREWARWVEEVVARYGSNGSLWTSRPDLPYRPVSALQVWNEPNLTEHWPRPSVRGYVALLERTSDAIRHIDPGMRVVLAGIPSTRRGIRMRPYLRGLYRQPGFRGMFDVMAIHPYARRVGGVERGIEVVRRIMRRYGDGRRPTWVTEFGWATGGPAQSRFRVSVDDQAQRLTDAFDMFLAERDRWLLERVFWFSLRDRDLLVEEPDWFGPHTGLFYRSGLAKPAWRAFAAAAGGVAEDWLDRFSLEDEVGCGTQPSCG